MCELSSIEALANIGANLSEIVALVSGAAVIQWTWLARLGGIRGFALKATGLGVLCSLLGLATPTVVNFAAAVNPLLALLASCVCTIGIFALVVHTMWTPSRIAARIGHPKVRAIRVVNGLAFVPFISMFAYIAAMIMVSFTARDRRTLLPHALGCGTAHAAPTDDLGQAR